MTTDRLAALLHEVFPPATTARWPFTIEDVAARLAAHVTVGLDVERLAAALLTMAAGLDGLTPEEVEPVVAIMLPGAHPRDLAAAIARAYAATPQPALDVRPEKLLRPDQCPNCGIEDGYLVCNIPGHQPAPDALRAALEGTPE